LQYTNEDMLELSASFIEQPVMSLRTGGPVAVIMSPIINPHNLKVEGFYCQDRFEKKKKGNTLILVTQDIRDILKQGLVINDYETLAQPDELVRLRDVLQTKFELIGKPVETVSKQKVGKVIDFATENSTFYIQKLYIAQSLLKSFSGGQLSIDRTQIVEITNKKIVIQEILKGHKAKGTVPASAPATS